MKKRSYDTSEALLKGTQSYISSVKCGNGPKPCEFCFCILESQMEKLAGDLIRLGSTPPERSEDYRERFDKLGRAMGHYDQGMRSLTHIKLKLMGEKVPTTGNLKKISVSRELIFPVEESTEKEEKLLLKDLVLETKLDEEPIINSKVDTELSDSGGSFFTAKSSPLEVNSDGIMKAESELSMEKTKSNEDISSRPKRILRRRNNVENVTSQVKEKKVEKKKAEPKKAAPLKCKKTTNSRQKGKEASKKDVSEVDKIITLSSDSSPDVLKFKRSTRRGMKKRVVFEESDSEISEVIVEKVRATCRGSKEETGGKNSLFSPTVEREHRKNREIEVSRELKVSPLSEFSVFHQVNDGELKLSDLETSHLKNNCFSGESLTEIEGSRERNSVFLGEKFWEREEVKMAIRILVDKGF